MDPMESARMSPEEQSTDYPSIVRRLKRDLEWYERFWLPDQPNPHPARLKYAECIRDMRQSIEMLDDHLPEDLISQLQHGGGMLQ